MSMRLGRPRYFENDGVEPAQPFEARSEITKQLSHLVKLYPPRSDTFLGKDRDDLMGLYSGPTSIAWGLFLIAQRWPDAVEGKSLIEWSKEYLSTSRNVDAESTGGFGRVAITPKVCGIFSELAVRLMAQAVIEDDDAAAVEILSRVPDICVDSEGFQDEWCFGRAGFLYILRVLAHHLPAHREACQAAQKDVVEAMFRRVPGSESGGWRFYGKLYLGMGHGWMGNLTQMLLSDPTPARAAQLRNAFADCIAEQQPDGGWKCMVNDAEHANTEAQKREILSMGHGAPSMLLGLLSVRPIYLAAGDDEFVAKIDAAVSRSQDVIWRTGLLTKESCLLHGAAGNSLVLFGQPRKAKFLEYSVQERLDEGVKDGSIEESEPRSGLQKGIPGRVWAMLEYLDGRNGVFPAFNEV
ncbi:hypothetical protein HKX48_002693 [Thoreauomyces humboldtii]|nr:hypothetical protein HKX48_002693 [Thoreauomyces humboldtii]